MTEVTVITSHSVPVPESDGRPWEPGSAGAAPGPLSPKLNVSFPEDISSAEMVEVSQLVALLPRRGSSTTADNLFLGLAIGTVNRYL